MNIPLNHVRLSYPQLFKAKSFSAPRPGETPSEPKFSASAILDKVKHAALIEAIRAGMKAVAEEKWGVGKVPKTVKYCLRDGSEKEDTDGYGEDIMFVSASNAKRPAVVDKDYSPLTEESGKPYAGCYVHMSIRLWAQDNQFGKRINAQLRAVQFVEDGDAFGDPPVDPQKEFKQFEGKDDPSLE